MPMVTRRKLTKSSKSTINSTKRYIYAGARGGAGEATRRVPNATAAIHRFKSGFAVVTDSELLKLVT